MKHSTDTVMTDSNFQEQAEEHTLRISTFHVILCKVKSLLAGLFKQTNTPGMSGRPPHYIRSYFKFMANLLQNHPKQDAMSFAVGGDFEVVGYVEYAILRYLGLQPEHTVIDVGCGSGRLAVQLVPFLTGQYLGIDIVPELVAYAEELCQRPDWKFLVAPGLAIPSPAASADVICFFSVFTHLFHEESFCYLQEAKRVLKPQGRIIFSFLEFPVSQNWSAFEVSLREVQNPDRILNQFIGRDAIETWAKHLDLRIEAIYAGDASWIPLAEPIRLNDGSELAGSTALGQSVCVLTHMLPVK